MPWQTKQKWMWIIATSSQHDVNQQDCRTIRLMFNKLKQNEIDEKQKLKERKNLERKISDVLDFGNQIKQTIRCMKICLLHLFLIATKPVYFEWERRDNKINEKRMWKCLDCCNCCFWCEWRVWLKWKIILELNDRDVTGHWNHGTVRILSFRLITVRLKHQYNTL